MRSSSKYGEKNGKAGSAAFGFLVCERTGSSLRASGHCTSLPVNELVIALTTQSQHTTMV
jgi:hypothetical protein